MYSESVQDCFAQIGAYTDWVGPGRVLIVNTENYDDLRAIVNRLEADRSKRCIYVSEHVFPNGLPDIQMTLEMLRDAGCHVVVGISQACMLQGDRVLDDVLDELLYMSMPGRAIVLVSHCHRQLEEYLRRDPRLDNRILFVEGHSTVLPKIRLAASAAECAGISYDDGMAALMRHLERLTDGEIAKQEYFTVVTSFSLGAFAHSVYPVATSGGVFDVLKKRYVDLAGAALKTYGTAEQWNWLWEEIKEYDSFSAYVVTQFGSTTGLSSCLEDVMESGSAKDQWLLWLALKTFGAPTEQYLTLALNNSQAASDLEEHIYQDLLEVRWTDTKFKSCFLERKRLIKNLPENPSQVQTYCKLVGKWGKNAVFYLTDATEAEEKTFLETLSLYEWSKKELENAVALSFPELALYLKEFMFDETNTHLSDQDEGFRSVLTDYFSRYKYQKVCNRIKPDFLDQVNRLAAERPLSIYKLQPRSSILSAMNREKTEGYFFDALGVEYLSYIQAKCEKYGLVYEINVAHCELPSITVKNQDFRQYFNTKDNGDLDDLKHHSQIYDFEKCDLPIHIFRELEIVDKELSDIRKELDRQENVVEKAVIIPDHGASRLAVIYQHESQTLLQLEEKGKHSGRCCPAAEDPKIPEAVFEEGYAVLGNYERFKGSRKASVEAHGGTTLEETVIPIITLSIRPDKVKYRFEEETVKYRPGQTVEIVLFANVPMKQPRLMIDGTTYVGSFREDSRHAVFALEDLRRAGDYNAMVYEGNTYTGVTLPFTIERPTKIRNLGLQ